MEDLDLPRVVPGAADAILATLERLGFEWDGPVLCQSTRTEAYAAALARLQASGAVFACSCSRRELVAEQGTSAALAEDLFYPGTCRSGASHPERPLAWRLRVAPGTIAFGDLLQGTYAQDVSRAIGDFVLKRRDGLFAYQLAVVIDDAEQGITEVVRGADLLGNTPRQILLQRTLGLPQPAYAHLPLLVEPDGQKLSKSRRSLPAGSKESPQPLLRQVLGLLRQAPPPELAEATLAETWRWAIDNWRPRVLRGIRSIALEPI
jgi:glutamyl-Q tRNA(Asp) synthetase